MNVPPAAADRAAFRSISFKGWKRLAADMQHQRIWDGIRAVYVLWFESKPVYVGSTSDLGARLVAHSSACAYSIEWVRRCPSLLVIEPKRRIPELACSVYLPMSPQFARSDLYKAEHEVIAHLRPPGNVASGQGKKPKPLPKGEFVSVRQAAEAIGKTRARVYQWLAGGVLPHEMRYGRIVIRRKAFDRFMCGRGA